MHLLPAPIFRMTADLQARRRLGLTATLVREDGREGDVFRLIGPKRYDAPWKDIEAQGYIAPADCIEVRVDLPQRERMAYATAEPDERYRLAATDPGENPCRGGDRRASTPDEPHAGHRSVHRPARRARRAARRPGHQGRDHGRSERQRLFEAFRTGEITLLVVSARSPTSPSTCPRRPSPSRSPARSARARRRPSGSAGVLRPKGDGRTARFYTVVARDTVDADFAAHRQRFLAEQGYAYRIVDADDLFA